jgi:protease I
MAKIAALVGPEFEDSELTHPMKALEEAGHQVELLGREAGEEVVGKRGEEKVRIDAAAKDRNPGDYQALLIPGGHSPDKLRTDEDIVGFVREFDATGRPMAVICHGPQLLIEAGVVQGRTLTSWPSVRTDLRNAGANVVDQELCEDGNLITSRSPDDLDAFSGALVSRLRAAAAE